MRQGIVLAALGTVLGVIGALAAMRRLTSMMSCITPTDPTTCVTIVAAVFAAESLACWIPARRAARVDPMRVLGTD